MQIKDRVYHKRYSRKKFVHEQKRKGKPYKGYFYDGHIERPRFSNQEVRPPKQKKIVMPETFSLIDATSETIEFFHEIFEKISEHKPIFIDARDVQRITPDAIIYFILILEEIKEKHERFRIRGNLPKEKKCRSMMRESGFMNYVRGPDGSYTENTRIFTIREGTNVKPEVAKNILDYVRTHLGIQGKTNETKAIYSVIIEAMANTHNHATIGSLVHEQKWYLMAYYTDQDEVHFVFLDSGVGIPKTIRKNYKERIAKLFSGRSTKDHILIHSALSGDFRTSTGEHKRGKGLPKMRSLSEAGEINDFVILSNKGIVSIGRKEQSPLERKFHGTLISWKVQRKNR